MRDVDRDVAGISALADPVRRQLYRFVCAQAEPVSRDQAAEAVGVARHQAKFHLDRLESEGLLQSDYVRLTGRSGPGAGRPAKRYRRGGGELSVTIPPREYDLAGHIMAEAIADTASTAAPITEALARAAAAQGRAIAAVRTIRPPPPMRGTAASTCSPSTGTSLARSAEPSCSPTARSTAWPEVIPTSSAT